MDQAHCRNPLEIDVHSINYCTVDSPMGFLIHLILYGYHRYRERYSDDVHDGRWWWLCCWSMLLVKIGSDYWAGCSLWFCCYWIGILFAIQIHVNFSLHDCNVTLKFHNFHLKFALELQPVWIPPVWMSPPLADDFVGLKIKKSKISALKK